MCVKIIDIAGDVVGVATLESTKRMGCHGGEESAEEDAAIKV
jgi:hypothetical protein